jgi:hypothetical protein
MVEETGDNHQPVTSHWQTSSHNVVSSASRLSGIRTHNVSGDYIRWRHLSLMKMDDCFQTQTKMNISLTCIFPVRKPAKLETHYLYCWTGLILLNRWICSCEHKYRSLNSVLGDNHSRDILIVFQNTNYRGTIYVHEQIQRFKRISPVQRYIIML